MQPLAYKIELQKMQYINWANLYHRFFIVWVEVSACNEKLLPPCLLVIVNLFFTKHEHRPCSSL